MPIAKPVEVPPIKIGNVEVTIVGTATLVTHRFAEKAIRQMLDKQMGKANAKVKEPKDPEKDFLGGLYILPGTEVKVHSKDSESIYAEGHFGFPAIGLKAAIVRAATDAGLRMTDMQRAFRIPVELLEIICTPGAFMRQDMVRLESGVADVRFRPEFREWSIKTTIQYNRSVLSLEQLLNLIRIAGFGVGLGEWRPQKGGMFGTFALDPKVTELPDEEWTK